MDVQVVLGEGDVGYGPSNSDVLVHDSESLLRQ